MAAHLHWRLHVTAAHGASSIKLAMLAFRETLGGANAATGGTITTSFGAANNMFDPGMVASWDSDSLPAWVAYEFAAPADIQQVLLGSGSSDTQTPADYTVDYSDDGAAWTTLITVTGDTDWPGKELQRLLNDPNLPADTDPGHRYWRLEVTDKNDATYVGVGNVELRLTQGGANEATYGAARSSAAYVNGTTPWEAFDPNAALEWRAATMPSDLAYDFGHNVEIAQAAVTVTTGFPERGPKDYNLQYSDDAVSWTTLASTTGETAWSEGETRLLNAPVTTTQEENQGTLTFSDGIEAHDVTFLEEDQGTLTFSDGDEAYDDTFHEASPDILAFSTAAEDNYGPAPFGSSWEDDGGTVTLAEGIDHASTGAHELGSPLTLTTGLESSTLNDLELSSTATFSNAQDHLSIISTQQEVDSGTSVFTLTLDHSTITVTTQEVDSGVSTLSSAMEHLTNIATFHEVDGGTTTFSDASDDATEVFASHEFTLTDTLDLTVNSFMEVAGGTATFTDVQDSSSYQLLVQPLTLGDNYAEDTAHELSTAPFTLGDAYAEASAVFVAESFTLSSAVSDNVEQLQLGGSLVLSSGLETSSSVTDALTAALIFGDSQSAEGTSLLTSLATFTDAHQHGTQTEITTALTLTSAIEDSGQVGNDVGESLTLTDAMELQIVSENLLASQLDLSDTIFHTQFGAVALVMNAETGAPAQYRNWQFTDMMQVGDRVFAVGPEGLCEIIGGADNGEPIDAGVGYGFTRMGSSRKTRIDALWLDYTSDGELQATVETYDQEGMTHSYAMDPRAAAQTRTNRIKIGKGLKSAFWRVSIDNVAGADFSITNIDADVSTSGRRL